LTPEFAAQVRIVATTDPTPMPPLVATGALDATTVERLRAAFLAVEHEPSLAHLRSALLLKRFVVPDAAVFDVQKLRAAKVEEEGLAWP
jgi:ABC-type phosphate/phosphonate transport system substrate-binding protein